MELFDVIDEDLAAQMIDQHDRYTFGRIAIQRATLTPAAWYVYWGAKEAHTVLGEECTPFGSLAAALEWALSPRNHERLEERD